MLKQGKVSQVAGIKSLSAYYTDALALNKLIDVRDLSLFAASSAASANNISHKQKILIVDLVRDVCFGRLPRFVGMLETFPYLQTAQFACPKRTGYLLRDAGSRTGVCILNDWRVISKNKVSDAVYQLNSNEGRFGIDIYVLAFDRFMNVLIPDIIQGASSSVNKVINKYIEQGQDPKCIASEAFPDE